MGLANRLAIFSSIVLHAIVCLGFPRAGWGQEAAGLAELRIEIRRRGESSSVLKGDLSLRPVEGKGSEILLSIPAAGGTVAARVPAKSSWALSVKSSDVWGRPEVFSAGEAGSVKEYVISLWPLARLSGSLRMLDKGEPLPREVTARVASPPLTAPSRKIPRVEVPCPVEEKGAFRCDLPAGTVDASFRARGLVPVYRWSLALRGGETSALGVLEMKKGASLAGWVEVEEGAIDPETCTARLSPLLAAGRTAPVAEERLKEAVLERKVGKDGFFQIDGVAPGAYQLEIEQPGYAPARVFPLDVWEGSETLLKDQVVLKRPLAIRLTIDPPLDWLGKPWRVTMGRKSDFSGSLEGKPAFSGQAGAGGEVRIDGQAPGRFAIEVADSLGNRLYHDRDVAIEHAGEAQRVVEIELITVDGRITLGKEPLEATLWFGGRFGAVRVKMAADEEGRFEGVLPQGGAWTVEVEASDPKLRTEARVEVKPDGKGEAEVEIKLPNTYVFGKVVDEAGRPVPRARVDFGSLNGSVTAESGSGGEFDLHAVPEGRGELSATFESRSEGLLTSDVVTIDAVDSVPQGPVNLVLRRTRLLQGRVQSSRGPVAGATIRIVPHDPPQGNADRVRSGLDGSFSLRVDAGAESVLAIVSPPGHAFQVFEVPVKGSGPVVLNVSPEGGTLEVALPFTLKGSDQVFFIYQNRLPLDLGSLLFWAEGHGVRFEDEAGLHIPRLAPGDYEVCHGPITFSDPGGLADWKARTATCAKGSLGNGGTLRLDLRGKRETNP